MQVSKATKTQGEAVCGRIKTETLPMSGSKKSNQEDNRQRLALHLNF